MTDKERAEEYVDSLLNKDDAEIDKFLDENLGDLQLNKRQAETILGIIKGVGICSFLAGLKAGKSKWHEIENHVKPNREIAKKYMPKGNQKVMVKYHFYNDEEIHYSDGYYNAYDFEFHIPNNPISRIICVIAWHELPEFEEN